MSRKRKQARGNPAAQHEESRTPGAARAAGGSSSRGLRGFREARRRGEDISNEPQRRPSGAKERPSGSGGGMLAEANRRAAEGNASNPRLLVFALLAVTVFMFIYLYLYAMPQMTHFAGGFSMPNLRLTGYDVDDVERLRGVMDSTATGQLNFLHKTAGMIFPIAVLLTTWAVTSLVMRRGALRWCVLAAAAIFVVVDIAENFLIDRILTMEPLDAGLVALSSGLTVAGWALLVLVGAVVVGTVVMSIVQKSLSGPDRSTSGSAGGDRQR